MEIDNYSSDLNSFESINEITDNYREIVDSYIILNDYHIVPTTNINLSINLYQ
jgi:hypothetical protein